MTEDEYAALAATQDRLIHFLYKLRCVRTRVVEDYLAGRQLTSTSFALHSETLLRMNFVK